jgi:hypothetical protein
MAGSIRRKAGQHANELLTSRDNGTLRADEAELVNRFESTTAKVLDDYVRDVPREPRKTDALVFHALYQAATPQTVADTDRLDSDEHENLRTLLAALLAAEAEANGPLRLTTAQTLRLARIAERLGHELRRRRLPLHAALAFTRAAALNQAADDQGARDRCVLAGLRARHQAREPGIAKARETAADWLCGYGYEPYRLLGWGAFQLVAFSLVFILGFGTSVANGTYVALVNYLNPLGSDEAGLSKAARIPLLVESYAGLISTSVFFALIVRRWFRL